MLVKTITAFTVAHSITLAVATLGYASLPGPPFNAASRCPSCSSAPRSSARWRGETSLTIRHPWVVAFAFGLLHGFGFASGLATMGLPHVGDPQALLLFNVGVELGQLVFVPDLALERSFRLLGIHWPRWVEVCRATRSAPGAYWTIQRRSPARGWMKV